MAPCPSIITPQSLAPRPRFIAESVKPSRTPVVTIFLAPSLRLSKQLTDSYQTGFLAFASLAMLALVSLSIKRRWRTTWGAVGVAAARI